MSPSWRTSPPTCWSRIKNRRGQQRFAVFGEPDADVRSVGADEFEVEVRSMDVYGTATGEVASDDTTQIAAWFLRG